MMKYKVKMDQFERMNINLKTKLLNIYYIKRKNFYI
jgi:hypothetical protein